MRLGKSTAVYSIFSLASKASGYIRDLFLAAFIGTSVISDIFFIALRLPMMFRVSFSEETFNSAYIPTFGKLQDLSEKEKQYELARKILLCLTLFFIPFVILCEIFMPSILRIVAPGINEANEFTLLVEVSRIIFPLIIIIVISAIFIGTLNANNRFGLSAGLPIILNLSILSSIFFFPLFETKKIILLSWGVIIGGIIQLIFLFSSTDRGFWRTFFSFKRNYTSLKSFFSLLWPTFLSSTFLQFSLMVNMLIASYVSGAMSYLYYSQRIYWLPLTIIGIAMGSVLIPNLSASIRSINIQQALTVQKQAYKYCILTVLPATFCLVFLSDEIITVFFQRGEFSYESTIQTSLSLKLLLLGLPAATLVKILTPYFFAIEKPKIALKISVITNSINLALTISLFQLIGYIAIPLSLSISAWVNLLILLYTHKKLNFFHFDSEMISYSLKYLFLSGFLLIVLLIFDFFQFVTNNIYLDLLIETTVVLMLWICFIYFFDKEIRNIFILAGKKIGMKYFSD